jgi:GTP pyrophosphokinase
MAGGVQESLFTDAIYVLTPQGKVIDLPRARRRWTSRIPCTRGSAIRCRGAKVDGQMVPLNFQLSSGQRVGDRRGEAGRTVARLAQPGSGIRPRQPCPLEGAPVVQGAAARGDGGAGPRAGRARARAPRSQRAQARRRRREGGLRQDEEFFAAFARDDINSKQVQTAILALAQPNAPATRLRSRKSRRVKAARRAPAAAFSSSASIACSPGSRAAAAGATRSDRRLRHARQGRDDPSRDVQQHRAHAASQPERLIDANWGERATSVSRRHRGRGNGPPGIAARHFGSAVAEKINVTAANTLTKNLHSRMAFTIEVPSLDVLSARWPTCAIVKGVLNATRR